MRSYKLFAVAVLALSVAALTAAIFAAESSNKAPAAGMPQLPTGWTVEDVQAMMAAGTPGKMHELLAKDAGTWKCKSTSWMGPGSEPMMSEGKSVLTPIMDGRYVKLEMSGELPGMGPYTGFAIYGFDNVSQKFVSTWIDSQSTGMMTGEGELSADGKTLTWEYVGNCPLTKKPMKMHEVDATTGPNTKTLEMFGADPKTGVEFKMMHIDLARE